MSQRSLTAIPVRLIRASARKVAPLGSPLARTFIIMGIGLVAIGLLWPWLGRLPEDIVIDRGHFKFYFPLTSGLLVSLLVSLILSWFRH